VRVCEFTLNEPMMDGCRFCDAPMVVVRDLQGLVTTKGEKELVQCFIGIVSGLGLH
jgi:hypothetical protein